jgi:hypothetical protein
VRQVRRNPSFSAIAIATLALGTGGMTAMFSAFDAVLVRPLPYADADRLVMIWDDMTGQRRSGHAPAPAEWLEWRPPPDGLHRRRGHPTDGRDTVRGWGRRTSSGTQGDGESLERTGRQAADRPGLHGGRRREGRARGRHQLRPVAAAATGASPAVLGRKITVNDGPYEVVGVMPREFYFMPARDIDIWMPASFPRWMRKNFTWHDAQVIARLEPGVTVERAQESMAALSRQVTAKDFRGPHSVAVKPLREEMTGRTQTALVVLLWRRRPC